jgi:thiamine-monophosphate kinase
MSSGELSEVGESGWLELVRGSLSAATDSDLLVPIGDDAAVFRPREGQVQIATCDAQVEGTHFDRTWLDWGGLARRALLAAASDVTAMGGKPTGFLVTLGVPSNVKMSCLEEFADSLASLALEYGLLPLGGDTVQSGLVFVDVTVLGIAAQDEILRQTGAEEGDALWVTGWLGGMRAALIALQSGERETENEVLAQFWSPPVRWPLLPRLREMIEIRALTDLSDGLETDLGKILRNPRRGAEVHLEKLPVSARVKQYAQQHGLNAPELAYLGGEDFELLLVEKGNNQACGVLDLGGAPLTRIGIVTSAGDKVRTLRQGREVVVADKAFRHFG